VAFYIQFAEAGSEFGASNGIERCNGNAHLVFASLLDEFGEALVPAPGGSGIQVRVTLEIAQGDIMQEDCAALRSLLKGGGVLGEEFENFGMRFKGKNFAAAGCPTAKQAAHLPDIRSDIQSGFPRVDQAANGFEDSEVENTPMPDAGANMLVRTDADSCPPRERYLLEGAMPGEGALELPQHLAGPKKVLWLSDDLEWIHERHPV
jgi:hypothetical protein